MGNGVEVRIRTARRKRGLSQAALANLLGLHRSAISQWEMVNGTLPSFDNLARVAVILDVSFEWLAMGRGEMLFEAPAERSPFAWESLAQDTEEERALAALRRIPQRRRTAVIDLLEMLT